jgi:hypothetical protein
MNMALALDIHFHSPVSQSPSTRYVARGCDQNNLAASTQKTLFTRKSENREGGGQKCRNRSRSSDARSKKRGNVSSLVVVVAQMFFFKVSRTARKGPAAHHDYREENTLWMGIEKDENE